MIVKHIMQVLTLCGILLGCSDQKDTSDISNKCQNEMAPLEQNYSQEIKESNPDSKETRYFGGQLLKEKEEKKVNDFCQKIKSPSQKHCVDSLHALIEIRYDSLSQTELFKKMKEKQIEEQKKYAEQTASKRMPNPPGPESLFRLFAIKDVLGEK